MVFDVTKDPHFSISQEQSSRNWGRGWEHRNDAEPGWLDLASASMEYGFTVTLLLGELATVSERDRKC